MKLPLIAGNWKMNCNHFEAIALLQKVAWSLADKDYRDVDVLVLPPFTDLRSVQTLVDGDKMKIVYGAQDLSQHANGAYTGDISGSMLAKLGCSYVLCGHSERRQFHHEDDAVVNAKVKAALGVSITPILCVGEPMGVRKAGDEVEHVVEQLKGSLAKVPAEAIGSMVIAYEPIWAIGTGRMATPEQAQEAIAFIRALVAGRDEAAAEGLRILYGGSVKPENAAELLSLPDIDGALVGGASLDPVSFAEIAAAAAR